MPKLDNTALLIGAGLILGIWLLNRQSSSGSIAFDLGQNLVGGAANAVTDAAAGAVVGVGQAVGIPATNVDACSAAKAAGDTWNASFACPATDFLSWEWNRL